MGIADRDYARGPRTRAERTAVLWGGWTFNTWLIVINVGLYVLAGLVFSSPGSLSVLVVKDPPQPAWVTPGQWAGRVYGDDRLTTAQAPAGARVSGMAVPQAVAVPVALGDGRVVAAPVSDPRTGETYAVGIVQNPLEAWGAFSTSRGFLALEVWRLVTFQFLHASPSHLFMNMVGLWFVGGLVETSLGSRRYAAFYLACGIFGAVAYLLLNFVGYYALAGARVPGVLINDPRTPLVGASAGIFGVLMAAAYLAPREKVLVFFVLPMRMRTAVYALAGITAANLLFGGSNQGGEAAHAGGAIAGYFFVRRTHLLSDFFDVFTDSRAPGGAGGAGGSAAASGAPATAAGRGLRVAQRLLRGANRPPVEGEIDRLLVKIRRSGKESLSVSERATLVRATRYWAARGAGGGGGDGGSGEGKAGQRPGPGAAQP
ncbi:MAG: hypothetical protein C0475_02730 [Planctomyces sp.]|nr:hypothetical protein [Planctomyces sp.]